MTSSVWQPPTGRPAGRDPEVRRSLSQLREHSDRLARTWSGLVFLAVLCLFAGLWASLLLATLAVVVTGVRMAGFWFQVGRHLGAMERLLAAEPARSVDAESLGGRLLKIDGKVLRFPTRMPTGRVWVVGPNRAGEAVVFVDAVITPNFGQVVSATPEHLSVRPQRQWRPWQAARAAGRSAARAHARRWLFTIVVTISIGAELAPQPQVLGWLYAIAGSVILVLAGRQWLRIVPSLHASRQLREPLVEYPARVITEKSVAVTLPDGSELTGVLLWSVQLLANVRASGRLWVAGEPATGTTLGVGVPEYPIAGVVRFN
ncbi:hypothetical protein [Kutzneria buriramensis]|uniref:hypothetical protein n=1 Tax=Kutzneria buriramensis TaxID=1045776 RepID=UPI0011C17D64|nr:hypothetical protein [Kutzneria buriramensis]